MIHRIERRHDLEAATGTGASATNMCFTWACSIVCVSVFLFERIDA